MSGKETVAYLCNRHNTRCPVWTDCHDGYICDHTTDPEFAKNGSDTSKLNLVLLDTAAGPQLWEVDK